MNLETVRQIFNIMDDRKFLLCYNGNISHELIKSLLSVAENKLNAEESDLIIKKKVFNVMMECLQSICRGENNAVKNSFFMLGKGNDSYDIHSCFYVSETYCTELKSLLEEVNSWDTEKLKMEHKNYILNKENNPMKRLLLPFIDISLKSMNRLQFEYEGIEDKYFFTVKTSIKHKLLINEDQQ